jgi:hypothetical protein
MGQDSFILPSSPPAVGTANLSRYTVSIHAKCGRATPAGQAHFSEPGLIARCVNGCFAIGRHRSRRNMRCRRCGGKVLYAPAAGG